VPDEYSVLAGDTLVTSRYRISRTIGAGGMATVYGATGTIVPDTLLGHLNQPSDFARFIHAAEVVLDALYVRLLPHGRELGSKGSGSFDD